MVSSWDETRTTRHWTISSHDACADRLRHTVEETGAPEGQVRNGHVDDEVERHRDLLAEVGTQLDVDWVLDECCFLVEWPSSR